MANEKHVGGCHCGAVRYEVELDLEAAMLTRCNCRICTKKGALGTIVRPAAFRLISGEEALGGYRGAHPLAGAHRFCTRCGIHVFGEGDLPELGGAFVSVNCNTLDDFDPWAVPRVLHWDGRHDNWHAGPREVAWPVRGAA